MSVSHIGQLHDFVLAEAGLPQGVNALEQLSQRWDGRIGWAQIDVGVDRAVVAGPVDGHPVVVKQLRQLFQALVLATGSMVAMRRTMLNRSQGETHISVG